MRGWSKTKKSVYFSVNFKRFAEGSKKFRICSNNIKRTYDIISRFFYWLTAKYTNSDSITKNYAVLKITHKEPFPNLSECAVVLRRFSQKWDVIWSPEHHPCLVLGLVYWKQEKHLWALVFSSYRSSMNFTNFQQSKCLWRNLCMFVISSFLSFLPPN